jgi:hypothetical protein
MTMRGPSALLKGRRTHACAQAGRRLPNPVGDAYGTPRATHQSQMGIHAGTRRHAHGLEIAAHRSFRCPGGRCRPVENSLFGTLSTDFDKVMGYFRNIRIPS